MQIDPTSPSLRRSASPFHFDSSIAILLRFSATKKPAMEDKFSYEETGFEGLRRAGNE
jgi:hypothetical protein